jgi:hypothetical protein
MSSDEAAESFHNRYNENVVHPPDVPIDLPTLLEPHTPPPREAELAQARRQVLAGVLALLLIGLLIVALSRLL